MQDRIPSKTALRVAMRRAVPRINWLTTRKF
jgi:hypothetical protein